MVITTDVINIVVTTADLHMICGFGHFGSLSVDVGTIAHVIIVPVCQPYCIILDVIFSTPMNYGRFRVLDGSLLLGIKKSRYFYRLGFSIRIPNPLGMSPIPHTPLVLPLAVIRMHCIRDFVP